MKSFYLTSPKRSFIDIKPVLSLILIILCPDIAKPQTLEPDSVYTYTFPQLSLPLASVIRESGKPTSLSFYLPVNYSPDKLFPMVLYIAGGDAGYGNNAGRGKSFFDTASVITVDLPIYKMKVEPLLPDSSNYYHRMMILKEDSEIIWENYRFLLDTLFELIPNIDRKNTFMGGFSNGAHTTAILINRPETEITKYFTHFYFIEGGPFLENFSSLKDCDLLFLQGGLNERDWLRTPFEKATSAGINAKFIKMEGFGHIFPTEYHKVLLDWIQKNIH